MPKRYCWLIDCTPTGRSKGSPCVYVRADRLQHQDGALIFSDQQGSEGAADPEYVIAMFAPGEWSKVEITKAFMGEPNGIFDARPDPGSGDDG